MIFDSIKNKKWIGQRIRQNDSSLILVSSAKVEQIVNIPSGEYTFRVLGKKRTGDGSVAIALIGKSGEIVFSKKISFTSKSGAEYSFAVSSNEMISKIKITRSSASFGSIEISRLLIAGLKKDKRKLKKRPRILHSVNLKPLKQKEKSKKREPSVAFVIPYGIYGGAEVYIENIVKKFPSNCHIDFIYLRKNPIRSKIDRKGVYHHDIKSINSFGGFLKSMEFDYVVYYNSQKIYMELLKLKGNGLKSKLIEIYHSDFYWNDALSNLKVRRFNHAMISVSPSLANDILGVEHRKVIPVGIDLDKFRIRDKDEAIKQIPHINSRAPIIGTVARLSPEKNLGYLIVLAKRMKDAQFIVIGDGPQASSLKENAPDNVYFLGFRSDVNKILPAMDLFLLPSKMEGTPISILEAMASGVPVFASNVGAIGDIIEDEFNGYFLSMNPDEDAKRISEVIYNSEIVVENALDVIRESHDIKKCSQEFYELLFGKGLLSEREIEPNDFVLPGRYL